MKWFVLRTMTDTHKHSLGAVSPRRPDGGLARRRPAAAVVSTASAGRTLQIDTRSAGRGSQVGLSARAATAARSNYGLAGRHGADRPAALATLRFTIR